MACNSEKGKREEREGDLRARDFVDWLTPSPPWLTLQVVNKKIKSQISTCLPTPDAKTDPMSWKIQHLSHSWSQNNSIFFSGHCMWLISVVLSCPKSSFLKISLRFSVLHLRPHLLLVRFPSFESSLNDISFQHLFAASWSMGLGPRSNNEPGRNAAFDFES